MLSVRILLAINDSIFLDTYLFIGLAPNDSLYALSIIYCLHLFVSLIFICLSFNLYSISLIILSNISYIVSFVNELKVIISSILFKNSGLNVCFNS
jgi:hypothetical protein